MNKGVFFVGDLEYRSECIIVENLIFVFREAFK